MNYIISKITKMSGVFTKILHDYINLYKFNHIMIVWQITI